MALKGILTWPSLLVTTLINQGPNIECMNGVLKKSFWFRASKLWLNLPDAIMVKSKKLCFNEFKKCAKNELINEQRTVRMSELFDIIDEYELMCM